MRTFSYPSWSKDFEDRVNATGGAGMPVIVQNFGLFNRAGVAGSDTRFLADLTALVKRHEAAARLKSLWYPDLTGDDWKTELHTWMQAVYDALHEMEGSPKIVVPEPPDFNRAQRRLLKSFKLGLFFVPAWKEKDYPKRWVKPNWKRHLNLKNAVIQHIKLTGCWIAFEMIHNFEEDAYRDDLLMQECKLSTRFRPRHSGMVDGDDLVDDILPKVAKVFDTLGGTTRVQSVEVSNFMQNLFRWLTSHTTSSFPDLDSINHQEWCENLYGSDEMLLVGYSCSGGLAYVDSFLRDGRNVRVAFRFMVQFPALSEAVSS